MCLPVNADCLIGGDNEVPYLDLSPYRMRLKEHCMRAGLDPNFDDSNDEDFDMAYYVERLKKFRALAGLDTNLDDVPEVNLVTVSSVMKAQHTNLDSHESNSSLSSNSSAEGVSRYCLPCV